MSDGASTSDIGRFYSAISRPYDRFATSRIFAGLRREAVDALDLSPGDRVLDIGCGTGGNLPHIDRAMGGEGSYVGVDISNGMLSKAQSRSADIDAEFIRADASEPPVRGAADAILVTFVNGVLPDPRTAVRSWVSLLEPDGRIVLLDAAGRRGRKTPLELGFRTFVVLAAPPGTRSWSGRSSNEVLIDRVESAHETLAEEAIVDRSWRRWRGFVRYSVASRK